MSPPILNGNPVSFRMISVVGFVGCAAWLAVVTVVILAGARGRHAIGNAASRWKDRGWRFMIHQDAFNRSLNKR
jgi:hypothetical protein